jgi:hypothetical protein
MNQMNRYCPIPVEQLTLKLRQSGFLAALMDFESHLICVLNPYLPVHIRGHPRPVQDKTDTGIIDIRHGIIVLRR